MSQVANWRRHGKSPEWMKLGSLSACKWIFFFFLVLGGRVVLLFAMIEKRRQGQFICTVGRARQSQILHMTSLFRWISFFSQNWLDDTTTYSRDAGTLVSLHRLSSWIGGRAEPSCTSWSWATHLCNRWASNSCGAPQCRRCFIAALTSDFATWTSLLLPLLEREGLCCQKHKCCLVTAPSAGGWCSSSVVPPSVTAEKIAKAEALREG